MGVDSHRDSLHEQLSHLPQHHHGSHQKEDAGYEGGEGQRLRPRGRLRGAVQGCQAEGVQGRRRGSWRPSWTSPPRSSASPPSSWRRRRSSWPPASSSRLSTLLVLGFLNIFFRSQLLFQAHLYIGLAIFCGFIMFDTQVIIRKARNGDKDFIAHSLDLFIDFVQIFRKVLILLMQKDERDNKKRQR